MIQLAERNGVHYFWFCSFFFFFFFAQRQQFSENLSKRIRKATGKKKLDKSSLFHRFSSNCFLCDAKCTTTTLTTTTDNYIGNNTHIPLLEKEKKTPKKPKKMK
jgi:hypothetical protein